MIFRKPRGDPGSLGLHLVAEASLGERPTARICKSQGSFCLSEMLTSIVSTADLYHLGRFKRLIVQDIQTFQGLRGTLPLPAGLEPAFPP